MVKTNNKKKKKSYRIAKIWSYVHTKNWLLVTVVQQKFISQSCVSTKNGSPHLSQRHVLVINTNDDDDDDNNNNTYTTVNKKNSESALHIS